MSVSDRVRERESERAGERVREQESKGSDESKREREREEQSEEFMTESPESRADKLKETTAWNDSKGTLESSNTDTKSELPAHFSAAEEKNSQEQHVEFTTESSESLADTVKETTTTPKELRQNPNPISQNLLLKRLRKWRNAPDSGAEDTGADDKDPETAGPGLETAGLGAGSADLPAG